MIVYFAKDSDGQETIFLDNPSLEDDEELENPTTEFPEPQRWVKTGKKIWMGHILFLPYSGEFNKQLNLPDIEDGTKIQIEIDIKVLS